jgi:hypothetical protein
MTPKEAVKRLREEGFPEAADVLAGLLRSKNLRVVANFTGGQRAFSDFPLHLWLQSSFLWNRVPGVDWGVVYRELADRYYEKREKEDAG